MACNKTFPQTKLYITWNDYVLCNNGMDAGAVRPNCGGSRSTHITTTHDTGIQVQNCPRKAYNSLQYTLIITETIKK